MTPEDIAVEQQVADGAAAQRGGNADLQGADQVHLLAAGVEHAG